MTTTTDVGMDLCGSGACQPWRLHLPGLQGTSRPVFAEREGKFSSCVKIGVVSPAQANGDSTSSQLVVPAQVGQGPAPV